MTDNIKWGPEIKVDGKRPEWLKDHEEVNFTNSNGYQDVRNVRGIVFSFALGEGPTVKAIRLPADHEHYRKKVPAAGDVPEWAKDRAFKLYEASTRSNAIEAWADYIAAHEEPPVDPIVATINVALQPFCYAGSSVTAIQASLAKHGLEIVEKKP